jgi:hypothetical protein
LVEREGLMERVLAKDWSSARGLVERAIAKDWSSARGLVERDGDG